jgi:Ca2+-binding RTX toxin-like protein
MSGPTGGGFDCAVGPQREAEILCTRSSLDPGSVALALGVRVPLDAAPNEAVSHRFTVRAETYDPVPDDADTSVVRARSCTEQGAKVQGTRKDDVLCGTKAENSIAGGDGGDVLYGFAGKDTLSGGAGDDHHDGGPGKDKITAGAGADTVFAADGARDVVDCGKGKDLVVADAGVDVLTSCETRA